MLTQEQKLSKFLTAIDEYAEKERTRILAELEQSNRIAIEKAEKVTLDDAYEIINQRTNAVRMQVSRDNARRESDAKNDLIRKRNTIEAEVFSRAAQKLREYTKTDGYRTYLENAAKKAAAVLGSENTVIFMRGEDMALKDDVVSAFGKKCTVCEDESIKIGGLRFENEEACRAIDATFDSALYSQRDEFAKKSGLRVL